MASALATPKFNGAEFLAWESTQTDRHFFVGGEVFAMAGGTAEHNNAAGNVFAALKAHLRGGPCATFVGDMRVEVGRAEAYFYPDVVVTCSERDRSDPKATTLHEPRLIVEVLSPSTESFDRGRKFELYRTLASLMEYVVVDPDRKTVDLFRRNAHDVWELHPSNRLGESVDFQSVELSFPIDRIFE